MSAIPEPSTDVRRLTRLACGTIHQLRFMLMVLAPILACALHAAEDNPAHSRETIGRGSRIVRMNGVPTLEVDGAPFLLVGAQCDIWRSTRQDEKTIAFFEGYQKMNATTVSIGVPWSKIETAEGLYDFRFLDWFIDQAQKRDLKLVINLFNSNVCGKIGEAAGSPFDPGYTPSYILTAPTNYQRMSLPGPWTYDWAGPPMCPNDPRTLERERLYCVKVAEHLKQRDTGGTVIMLQIDNEFYYMQWAGDRPKDEKAIRCHCRFCEEKWNNGAWKDGEDFMFHSFADYVKSLTDAISAIHPLLLYVNSPWWPPHVIPIFLDQCPNLALVGVDGVSTPSEPNMLSRSQLSRNIPFASENPTENPSTRYNLDVLPYYTLIGQQGIGNLLWECGPPHTVVEDPQARTRYGAALYPIRWAQTPIAKARGTENLIGWCLIREIAADATTDIFGNFIPTKGDPAIVQKNRLFVSEGTHSRIVETNQFSATLNELRIEVSDSAAGVIIRRSPTELVLAVPTGRVTVEGTRSIQVEEGRFERDHWIPDQSQKCPIRTEGATSVIEIREPKVILLTHPPIATKTLRPQ